MKSIGTHAKAILKAKTTSESPIEVQMFNALMNTGKLILVNEGQKAAGAGLFLHPQHPVGRYTADFLIKAVGWERGLASWPPTKEANFCVECDGRAYHTTDEAIKHDKERDRFFKSRGIETLRYSGSSIYKHADYCASEVINHIKQVMVVR